MPDLNFQIEGAEAVPYAASPLLHLKTRITCNASDLAIQNIILQCQVQIEPTRRHYDSEEQANLGELFGVPARWGQTLRPLLWTNANLVVPAFRTETTTDIPLPCTFDFNVATTKYFHGLETGEIPICVLFSGTIFYADSDGSLQVSKIPWSREANYKLPLGVWKEMIEMYYPNTTWLCLQRDLFDQLYRYKRDRGLVTWDESIESLLSSAGEIATRKLGI